MTCEVYIPAPLRELTGGLDCVESAGGTVKEVFESLAKKYPSLLDRIAGPDGSVRSFVNVYVNDVDIRRLQGLDTPVADGDEVLLVPAIAGG